MPTEVVLAVVYGDVYAYCIGVDLGRGAGRVAPTGLTLQGAKYVRPPRFSGK